jgi:polar amino acid transport system substrate-binding protein
VTSSTARTAPARAGLSLLVLALAVACSGGGDTLLEGKLTPLGQRLPASIRETRIITVGSDVSYPPFEFFVEGDSQGVDVDLCQAMVSRLGSVACQFQNTQFSGILLALREERFDIVMSAMSDTTERQAQADFIDYFTTGSSILVRKGNPEGIRSLDDLCGRAVAVEQGTVQEQMLARQNAACLAQGRPAIALGVVEQDSTARHQVLEGLVAADLTDYPVASYAASTSGSGNDYDVVGDELEPGPLGIGVRKEDTELRDVLQEALRQIIADGTYDRVLRHWNVAQGSLKTAEINGGSRPVDARPA